MKQKLISAFLDLLSRLPYRFLYILSDFMYLLVYYVFGYRKKVVYENLKNAFPEKSKEERASIAQKFYRFFPDLIVEAIKMKTVSAEEVARRTEIINPEEVYRHLRANKGVIGVTSHYGNWELGIHRLSLMTDVPKLVIYKPLNNKAFNTVYNGMRSRFGAQMVPMKQILRHIVRLQGKPYFSVFVADQTPLHQESDYFMNFLNQDTLVYTGTERIARMTNNPVVFCHIAPKEKRGYYTCTFTTLVENPATTAEHEITQLHNQYTEKIIREQPEYWLWTHRRWKRKRRI